MWLGTYNVNELLTFKINTHDTSGVSTNTDSAPNYRIYEENGVTAIDTGTMSISDSTNTTGYYIASITLSAGGGYEEDKSYDIYIDATVGGDKGTTTHRFQIRPVTDVTLIKAQTDKMQFDSDNNILSNPVFDSTDVNQITEIVRTEIEPVKTQTDKMQFDSENNISSNPVFDSTDVNQITEIVRTEIEPVKTQTDKMQFDGNNNILSNPDITISLDSTSLNEIREIIETEIADGLDKALNQDQISELSAGNPAITPSITEAIMLLYMALRNATDTTRTEVTIKDNSGTIITKASLSYDGVKFNKGKYQAP